MKPHKFGDSVPCFGDSLPACVSCGAISVNEDMAPFSDIVNWLAVSKDCNRAAKQIELLQKNIELEENKEFYLWW